MKNDGRQLAILLLAFQALVVLLVSIPGAISVVTSGPSFSYDPHQKLGPLEWGHLYNNWTNCTLGHRQTPINILDKNVKVNASLGQLRFKYKPVLGEAYQTGHGIKVAIEGDGGSIEINGKTYNLIQYHWHWPSEHAINGKRHVLELHLVHSNPQGLAVVGVLFDYGHKNSLLKTMLPKFHKIGDGKLELGTINPKIITFKSSRYYRYDGSLTTPPCTEGVVWTVLAKVMKVSRKQLVDFEKTVNDSYTSTARPIQHLDGRLVFSKKPPRGPRSSCKR